MQVARKFPAEPGTAGVRRAEPWIVSRRQDLAFFVLSPWLTVLCLGLYLALVRGAGWQSDGVAEYFYLVFALGFDNPHILQTFSRTHGDRAERERHPGTHWGVLAGLVAVAVFWPAYAQTVAFQIFFAIFGLYHIYAQNVGFLKLYGRKDPSTVAILRLERLTLFGLFNAYLTRVGVIDLAKLEELGHWGTLAVSALGTLNVGFWGLTAVAGGALFYHYLRAAGRGDFRVGPRFLFLASLLVVYSVTYYSLDIAPVLMILVFDTLYHDVQYLRWMAHYQERSFTGRRIVLKWLVACLLLGVVFEFGERWSYTMLGIWIPVSAVLTALTVYHYYVDGIIWKFRTQPELAKLTRKEPR